MSNEMSQRTEVMVQRDEGLVMVWATRELVSLAAGTKGSAKMKERLSEEIRRDVEEIAGPSPTRVELILAETAALSLFALRTYEARFAAASSSSDGITFAQARYHQEKIAHAQRRLESALRTLANIRRLALPALQINVAGRQVNQLVSGSHAS